MGECFGCELNREVEYCALEHHRGQAIPARYCDNSCYGIVTVTRRRPAAG